MANNKMLRACFVNWIEELILTGQLTLLMVKLYIRKPYDV